MTHENERLLSLREAAQVLGTSPSGLYTMRSRGEGPVGYKIGARVRYKRADVLAWLETRREDPADRWTD